MDDLERHFHQVLSGCCHDHRTNVVPADRQALASLSTNGHLREPTLDPGLYLDRIAGGNCYHCHPGRLAVAGFVESQTESHADALFEQ